MQERWINKGIEWWRNHLKAADAALDTAEQAIGLEEKRIWWEEAQEQITVPEFIEQRAKGKMKMENGKIWVQRIGSLAEYMNKQMNDVYRQMDADMKAVLYGDRKWSDR